MPHSRPLHERLTPLNWLRAPLRRWFFKLFRKAWQTDDGKRAAVDALRGLLAGPPKLGLSGAAFQQPYPDLGVADRGEQPCLRDDVVIITARFRSGSTVLWNLFRQLDGFTSYYEPFNERRWFDPKHRGERIDPTHRGVSDYWREYEGLEELGQFYDERWIDHELYMSRDAWNPAMKQYVETLIAKAPGRAALQFNRIDFRLPWFCSQFPVATIIHLYRHPRDQWLSSLTEASRNFPRNGSVADFVPHDHFYLLNWCRDLKYHYPFLDERLVEHPYQLHYFLWKLSYVFAEPHADYSVAFETLVGDPDRELPKLLEAVKVERYDLAKLKSIISSPPLGKWKEYADDSWFRKHETACENVLVEFFKR
jgi:sulfotransferase family protein